MTPIRTLLGNAAYLTSVHNARQLPPDLGFEVAIAGRSNCGKSSLINRLCRRRGLARASRTPGRTRQLVFFELDADRRLVDLPGYGFAAVAAEMRRHWERLIQGYLERREALAGLVLVMDIRHPLRDTDRQLAGFALSQGLPLHVVLTKSDKLGHGKRGETLRGVQRELGGTASVQLFSAVSGLGTGELEAALAAWLDCTPD